MPIFCRGKCPNVEQPAVVGGDVVIENEVVVEEGRNGVLDAAVGGVVGAAEDDDVVEGGAVVIEDEVVVDEVRNGVLDAAVDGVVGAAEDDNMVGEVVDGLTEATGQLLLQ